jgi:hypothetical protein
MDIVTGQPSGKEQEDIPGLIQMCIWPTQLPNVWASTVGHTNNIPNQLINVLLLLRAFSDHCQSGEKYLISPRIKIH